LKGISENHVVWTWFFAWLNVVGCVVDVVFWHHGFWRLKTRQVFEIYFFDGCCRQKQTADPYGMTTKEQTTWDDNKRTNDSNGNDRGYWVTSPSGSSVGFSISASKPSRRRLRKASGSVPSFWSWWARAM
jgi:hypothetical protein